MEMNKKRLDEVLSYVPIDTDDFMLCGGTVRYIYGIQDTFRDVDIIVNNDFDVSEINLPYTKNMYGGYKFLNGKEIDVWKLKNHKIPCKNFDEVENTWLISIDAIFYHIGNHKLYNKYFSRSIKINWQNFTEKDKEYLNLKLGRFHI